MTVYAGRDGSVLRAAVTTPWYPHPHNRMNGSFVADHARLVRRLFSNVSVVHASEWPGGTQERCDSIRADVDRVLGLSTERGALPISSAVGPLFRVPVMIVGGASVPQRAEAAVRDTAIALGPRGLDADLVHGHVGYLGGLIASRLASSDARVFVTEHSTGLRAVLDDPQGLAQYAEVLDRCDELFCVSEVLRGQILRALPDFSAKVSVLPNPVDIDGVPRRDSAPSSLRRWLYVGGLIDRKGVTRLLEVFAAVAATDPSIELTMIGEGPLRQQLEETVKSRGLSGRVHLPGVLRHGELLAELPSYDVLVHLSDYETFGLSVLEAVAAGIPVVVTACGGPEETLEGLVPLVGRMVAVGAETDEVAHAIVELGNSLDDLDLNRAREVLASRYSPDAVCARLATAYGLGESERVAPPSEVAVDGAREPTQVTVLAVSAWRRYAVLEELAVLERTHTPALLVSTDSALCEQSAIPYAAPKELAEPGAPVAAPIDDASFARRMIRDLRRRKLAAARTADRTPSGQTTTWVPVDATILMTDLHSASLALRLLDASPARRLSFELDRGGAFGPTSDAEELGESGEATA